MSPIVDETSVQTRDSDCNTRISASLRETITVALFPEITELELRNTVRKPGKLESKNAKPKDEGLQDDEFMGSLKLNEIEKLERFNINDVKIGRTRSGMILLTEIKVRLVKRLPLMSAMDAAATFKNVLLMFVASMGSNFTALTSFLVRKMLMVGL